MFSIFKAIAPFIFSLIVYTLPAQDSLFCDEITMSNKKSDPFYSFTTPYIASDSSTVYDVIIGKMVAKEDNWPAYILSLTYHVASQKETENIDVVILLDNGEEIRRTNVESKIYRDKFGNPKNIISITLNREEVYCLANRIIIGFKASYYKIKSFEGLRYREYIRCLLTMK